MLCSWKAEFRSFTDEKKHEWSRRRRNVSCITVIISSGPSFALLSKDFIVRSEKCYHLSFLSEYDLLWKIVLRELKDERWSEVFYIAEKRTYCVGAIYSSQKKCAKARRCFSDELSSQKPNSWDMFLTALEYCFLHLRYLPHSEKQKLKRKNQVEKGNPKFLYEKDNGEWDFSLWRTADVTKLAPVSVRSNIGSLHIGKSNSNLSLFNPDVVVLCA